MESWETFVDPEGRFEVLMPDSVMRQVTPAETAIGQLEYVSYVSFAQGMSGNAHYIVSYCDYPAGTLHEDSTDLVRAFFEETLQGSLEAVNGKLMYQDEITVAGHPGMIWKVGSEATNLHVKSQALIVDRTYYTLQITTSAAHSLQHDGERFFQSFKLLDP